MKNFRFFLLLLLVSALLAGCAATAVAPEEPVNACKPEVDRLNALLAAEIAERQRISRAANRREEALRRQLDALKSIERNILEREDRKRTEAR